MNDNPDSPAMSVDDARIEKSDAAFRTISEVSTELNVPQHVLRFWESRFTSIKPLKRGGGRRYYRPEDLAMLRRIKELLYTDGMTIKGVQKLLREGQSTERKAATPAPAVSATREGAVGKEDMERMLAELTALRDDLRAALKVTA